MLHTQTSVYSHTPPHIHTYLLQCADAAPDHSRKSVYQRFVIGRRQFFDLLATSIVRPLPVPDDWLWLPPTRRSLPFTADLAGVWPPSPPRLLSYHQSTSPSAFRRRTEPFTLLTFAFLRIPRGQRFVLWLLRQLLARDAIQETRGYDCCNRFRSF